MGLDLQGVGCWEHCKFELPGRLRIDSYLFSCEKTCALVCSTGLEFRVQTTDFNVVGKLVINVGFRLQVGVHCAFLFIGLLGSRSSH